MAWTHHTSTAVAPRLLRQPVKIPNPSTRDTAGQSVVMVDPLVGRGGADRAGDHDPQVGRLLMFFFPPLSNRPGTASTACTVVTFVPTDGSSKLWLNRHSFIIDPLCVDPRDKSQGA
jgi:hypothetical protein